MKSNIFSQLGASNHSKQDRHEQDFYATEQWAVEKLLEYEPLQRNILEPSVGNGNIATVLTNKGHNVLALDIIDRGYPNTIVTDFMEYNAPILGYDVVCNPPYKFAQEHITHALCYMGQNQKLCALLKIQFLESVKRKQLFDKYPPKTVYVFRKRTNCAKNNDFDAYSSSAVCYAWFVWETGYTGETTLRWID